MPGDVSAQLLAIRRGTVQVISDAELTAKLQTGRQLIVKAGFDPTAPDLHLGHTVLFRKLRHFQDLGHKVIFVIGDATGLVGDPTGRSQARRMLNWDEVRTNAQTYQQQIKTILRSDREVFEVRYNSEWFLGRSPQLRTQGLQVFDFARWVELASKYTVARLIERDDFSQRLSSGKPLSLLELFYPLMQGYDSVKIAEQYGHCDIELGGSDQTFNLLVGRELLREYGYEPQVVLTVPLLEGLDGVQKMSKSAGNHVGVHDEPAEMFGKLMSIPDPMIVKYFTLLTDVEDGFLRKLEHDIATRAINPRDAKADLAQMIVSTYHGADAGRQAREQFAQVFSRREQPTDMPTVKLSTVAPDGTVKLIDILVAHKLADSNNDARRLIRQGAVKIDGTPVTTPTVPLDQAAGKVLQVGSRHFLRLVSPD